MNILVTYAGGIAGQSAIKMIRNSKYSKDIKIFGLDCDENAVGLQWVDYSYVCQPSDSDDYKNEILELIESENIDLILPTGEEDLSFLSDLKQSYMMNKKTINICQDKFKFYEHYKNKYNKDMPFTSNDLNDFEGFPFITKPKIGRGSRGFKLINGYKDLSSVKSDGMIFQEFLPGQEWTIDCLITKNHKLIIPRKRLSIKGGNSTCGEIELNEHIVNFVSNFIDNEGYSGPLCIQMIEDSKGYPKLTEINPRFGGGSIFSMLAGINFIDYIISELKNEDIKYKKPKEIKVVRYWTEIIL